MIAIFKDLDQNTQVMNKQKLIKTWEGRTGYTRCQAHVSCIDARHKAAKKLCMYFS